MSMRRLNASASRDCRAGFSEVGSKRGSPVRRNGLAGDKLRVLESPRGSVSESDEATGVGLNGSEGGGGAAGGGSAAGGGVRFRGPIWERRRRGATGGGLLGVLIDGGGDEVGDALRGDIGEPVMHCEGGSPGRRGGGQHTSPDIHRHAGIGQHGRHHPRVQRLRDRRWSGHLRRGRRWGLLPEGVHARGSVFMY